MAPAIFASLLINLLFAAAVSYAVGLISSRLLGGSKNQSSIGSTGSDIYQALATVADPGGPLIGIFGRRRVGGRIMFNARAGNTTHIIVMVSGAPIDKFNGIYINNVLATLGTDGTVLSEPWATGNTTATAGAVLTSSTALATSSIKVTMYDGRQTTVDAAMAAAFPEWTAQTIGRNIAFVHIAITPQPQLTFQTAFQSGLPDFTFDINGHRCYDPRNVACVLGAPSTYVWSENSAIILANYIVHDLGMKRPTDEVDWAGLVSEANVCDDPVQTISGTYEARFRCSAYFYTDQLFEDVIAELGSTMAGGIIPPGDLWRIWCGYYGGSPFAVDETMMADEGVTYSENTPLENLVNTVRVVFTSTLDNWENRDAPEYQNPIALSQDGGNEYYLDLKLPYVTSASQAQRLAKISFMFSRYGSTGELHANIKMLNTTSGDIIEITEPLSGINSRSFRVQSDVIDMSTMTIKFRLTYENSTFYDWNAATEELPYNGAIISAGFGDPIGAPGMHIVVQTVGSVTSATVNVTGSNSPSVSSYSVDYQDLTSGGGFVSLGTVTTIGATMTTAPLVAGHNYNFRAVAISTSSRSAYAYAQAVATAPATIDIPAPAVGIRWTSSTFLDYVVTAQPPAESGVTKFELYQVVGYYDSLNNFVTTTATLVNSTTTPLVALTYTLQKYGVQTFNTGDPAAAVSSISYGSASTNVGTTNADGTAVMNAGVLEFRPVLSTTAYVATVGYTIAGVAHSTTFSVPISNTSIDSGYYWQTKTYVGANVATSAPIFIDEANIS